MEDILKSLMTNGYQIYPDAQGKFSVKKNAVPCNSLEFEGVVLDTYEEAFRFAAEHFSTPQKMLWAVVARYDRGLGIEYRNLRPVESASREEAEILAWTQAEIELGGPKVEIKELRVRPKT